jgi:hypothetical protein
LLNCGGYVVRGPGRREGGEETWILPVVMI